MRILAINATGRPEGSTSKLVEKALQGAVSQGAQTEHLLLCQKDIRFCTNCLACYSNLDADIAPCSIKDDVAEILEKIKDADGIVMATPIHSGFTTGLMTSFAERAVWTLCKPTGSFFDLKGCPEPRLTDKPRGSIIIASAGGIPDELRTYCDLATPWLKDLCQLLFNGEVVGDLYAGAHYPRPVADDEWPRAYTIRALTDTQLEQAYALGAELAYKLASGQVLPYDAKRIEAAYAGD